LLNTILGSLSSGVAASTNSYESIATVTVGSGGASDITFTSIPSDYAHLQIRLTSLLSTSADVYLQFNADTGNNYQRHTLYGNGSAAGSYSETGNNRISIIFAANTGVGGSITDILDYKDTNKFKIVRALGGNDNNSTGFIALQSGGWRSTSAITSIKLYSGSGTISQYTHAALYGIKGA
jgi:hypothetical protein